jgi:hypothetical protein
VISTGAILLASSINHGDPLFLTGPFPWTWLAPVAIALRYGTGPGAVSLVIVLAAWLGLRQFGQLDLTTFPTISFLGGSISTLLCAEIASGWQQRLRKLEHASAYREQRLEELTRKHFLLQLSHDKLYQGHMVRPTTLLDSLRRLRELMAEMQADPRTRTATGLQALLDLLSNVCRITSAAVYRVKDGQVQPKAVASVGPVTDFEPGDPLVEFAIEKNTAAHINMEAMERASSSRYLVAAPLRNRDGDWAAVLLVDRMPFMAFTLDNLQTLLALVSYYADGLIADRDIAEVRRAYPDCPLEFIDALARVTQVWREVRIKSAIVVMTMPSRGRSTEVLEEFRRTQRALDLEWVRERDGGLQRVVLMPMSDDRTVSGFIARVEEELRSRYGERTEQTGIHMHCTTVRDQALPTLQAALGVTT